MPNIELKKKELKKEHSIMEIKCYIKYKID